MAMPGMSMHASTQQRGMSLLEVMVVISIRGGPGSGLVDAAPSS
jgi:prepilin-type N-terminal cleavage/methylation domain-containing protein